MTRVAVPAIGRDRRNLQWALPGARDRHLGRARAG
jgi:hypothetical protein